MNDPLVWMMIGVSDAGKTSVGRLLAQNLDCDYLACIIHEDLQKSLKSLLKLAFNDWLQKQCVFF